jgi:hypothetical protein
MLRRKFQCKILNARRTFFASLFCAVMLTFLVATSLSAQSGRRRPPARPEAPPVPETTGGRETAARPSSSPSSTAATRYNVYLTTYVRSTTVPSSGRIPLRTFTETLRRAQNLTVTMGEPLNRGEAHDRARASESEYVVWVHLESEITAPVRDDLDQSNPDEWFLSYVIFTPRTGAIMEQGRVYQRPTYASGGVLGIPPIGTSGTRRRGRIGGMPDYRALERMGREAAERVIADFDRLPPQQRP